MPRIDAIFLDLDGTLLTSDKKVNDFDRSTLIRCLNAGIQVILVSGRPIFYVKSIAQTIDPRTKCMAYNGAYYKDDQISIDQCFTKKHLESILDLLNVYSIEKYYIKGLDSIYFSDNDERFVYPDLQKKGVIEGIRHTSGLEITKPVYKLIILDSREDVLSQFAIEAKKFVSVTSSHTGSLDIMENNIDKGISIDTLMKTYHWKADNLMAFGDAINDLDMFKKVTYSFAMKNGMDVVKEHAWAVTDSHNENGIANAIIKYVEGI